MPNDAAFFSDEEIGGQPMWPVGSGCFQSAGFNPLRGVVGQLPCGFERSFCLMCSHWDSIVLMLRWRHLQFAAWSSPVTTQAGPSASKTFFIRCGHGPSSRVRRSSREAEPRGSRRSGPFGGPSRRGRSRRLAAPYRGYPNSACSCPSISVTAASEAVRPRIH
jgi:hypothetical protein